ncbi:hypothetical protein OC846_005683 [Tilletia horrida]|uniref:glucan 1,3-beta-glucosidase n=1 Tax=Tilletia horrida TaxID=155126 RepID=A0AAN6JQ04_9BASI|nr:hypothetical protein OC846_005683 [Tilletia horrida]KAK0561882.1 hypothetical protein OC861_005598 [Tilletia horrida]
MDYSQQDQAGYYTHAMAPTSTGFLPHQGLTSPQIQQDPYSAANSPRPSTSNFIPDESYHHHQQQQQQQEGYYPAEQHQYQQQQQQQQDSYYQGQQQVQDDSYYHQQLAQQQQQQLQHQLQQQQQQQAQHLYPEAHHDLSGYQQNTAYTASASSLLIGEKSEVISNAASFQTIPNQQMGTGLRDAYPMTSDGYHTSYQQQQPINLMANAPPPARASPAFSNDSDTPQLNEKKQNFQQRHPWWIRILIILALCAIAGTAVAVAEVFMHKHSSQKASTSSLNGKGPTSANVTYSKLPAWDWSDPSNRVYGVNLGTWLLLERWLNEDAFVAMCGPGAFDEFHCTQTLGANAVSALQDHYNTWITESDFDEMQKLGINTVRVTLGFWALIPVVAGEAYVNAGQMDQLKKALGWLNTRNMRAIISIHGLPGSQSGDQSTGQYFAKAYGSNWFTDENQQRSVDTIQAFANWYSALSPELASTITAVLPVNEPNQNKLDDGTFQSKLQAFYSSSYQILQNINLTMALHSGQGPNSEPSEWADWLSGKDPSTILWEAHPYPGWFPARSSKRAIYKRICAVTQLSAKLPEKLPIFIGEWSVLSNVTDSSFVSSYWQTQLAAYSQSAGSTFWTWKVGSSSNPVVALAAEKMSKYDFQTMFQQGIISFGTSSQTPNAFATSLPNDACELYSSSPTGSSNNDGSGSGSGSGSDVGDDQGDPPGSNGRRSDLDDDDDELPIGEQRRASFSSSSLDRGVQRHRKKRSLRQAGH